MFIEALAIVLATVWGVVGIEIAYLLGMLIYESNIDYKECSHECKGNSKV